MDAGKSSATALADNRLEQQFSDAKPLYTASEAIIEANRCLYCHDAPCITACPTGIDIPAFIRKIATGNIRGSAKTIFRVNMAGASTARVCPVEELCVGACVYNGFNETPIHIGRLQRYAVSAALEAEESSGRRLFTPKPDCGRKVALIGAGPASLVCAAHLALEGVTPIIYERDPLPGGLNTTGIAPYKFQSGDALLEIEWIIGHGVDIRIGVEVGQDVTIEQLLADHDALFIGVGLGGDTALDLPGSDGPGVWGATDLIRRIKNQPGFEIPADVGSALVIGAGNTAIDIARELAMLGLPDVALVYRRTEEEMSGYAHELEGARRYGVKLIEQVRPLEVVRSDGRVVGLKVLDLINNEAVELACDWVVEAVGQQKFDGALAPGVERDGQGRIIVDEATRRSGHPQIYAGGDCINGGQEVVNAAADGREAAFAMLRGWGLEVGLNPGAA